MKKQPTVWAEWDMPISQLPEDMSEFHISCGEGDGQDDGFFPDAPGSKLTILTRATRARVRLEHQSARASQLVRRADHWLSPNCVGDVEAKFGVTK